MDLVERFRGSILGLAIGDAIGHPTEFISSVARIKAKYGERGVTGFNPSGAHQAGTFTDDTQMTIAVMRALVRRGHASLDELMALMGDEFVAWAEHPSNNRAPGGTCLAGCRKLKQGAAWRDAGVKESKGCGAAMRAAPVGLLYFDDDDLMVKIAAAQSALTHSHPTGIASSVAAAAPVAWVAKGNGLDGIIEYTKKMVSKVTPDMLRDLKAREQDIEEIGIGEMMAILDDTANALGESSEDVCGLLGGAWVGEEAVACALWCVLTGDGDFKEAVLKGANSSGDSDSIACIAGSIVGALHGSAGIPSDWLAGVERTADLDALARVLHQVRSSGQDIPSIPGALDFFAAERSPAPVRAEPHGQALDVNPDELAIEELERLVEHHNALYWEQAAPVLSDLDFDRLTRTLQKRKPASSALEHLGARPDAGRSVTHREPMLSLDKCYERAELEKWAAEVACDVVVLPKIDGLACSLRYDASGRLEVAATRGDGEVGEDITPNARGVRGIPSVIDAAIAKGPLEIRGEVFMPLAVFDKHKADKANPRNLAAGALRQKDPNNTRKMELSFLAYDLKSHDLPTQRAKLALLKELGFQPIDVAIVARERAMDAVETFAARRASLGFETDGVVVMADAVAEQQRLGATAHHPRWAIAWKFQGEEGTSVLRGIEWSVARTGTITPVGLVDPVQLSGVTVTRATLHHRGQVVKLGLTIGATLAMVRRGGVIPHIERVLSAGSAPVVFPSACPACGAAVVQDGDFLLCSQPATCVAARVGRILHFLEAADVQGLGEVIVEEAVASGLIKSPADLYRLQASELAALEKCGDKNAEKIIQEIDKARSLPLDVVLRGLGIANLGKTAARTLAERFTTLDRVRGLSAGELSQLKGLGEVIAQSIVDGLKDNAVLLDALAGLVQISAGSSAATTGGGLAGTSFVFTGALSFDRKQAEARVKKLGASVPSGVTKALTHLVVGGSARDAPSTKQKAAEKLKAEGANITILDEAAFLALVMSREGAAPVPQPAPSFVTSPVVDMTTAAAEPPPAAEAAAVLEPESGDAEPVGASVDAPAQPPPAQKKQLTLF